LLEDAAGEHWRVTKHNSRESLLKYCMHSYILALMNPGMKFSLISESRDEIPYSRLNSCLKHPLKFMLLGM